MKHEPDIRGLAPHQALLAQAYRGLNPLARDLSRLQASLDHLRLAGGETYETQIRTLRQDIRAYAPSVTLIGQVKAGKTSLANAMAGKIGLLPSDINPWTSVVTSVNLSPRRSGSQEKAQFRFFTDAEWENLLSTGGRVGELASRAGADQELEKVRGQLAAMRGAARQRLGDQFEMLLGQTHDYGYVDAELVQRYVCLGDEADGNPAQGRFADITRSADLSLCQPALPMPICLRDTPGVNDTFMVREQITVNAIRGSRLCVVVLSAHQALSNVDLALVRLIANVPSRDVIIFVNRIDELTDPAGDIPEIRVSIQATLKSLNVPTDAEVLFGSARWANAALAGDLRIMGRDSAAALLNWARAQAAQGGLDKDTAAMVWGLSGLPALGQAIADRIVAGEGAAKVARISGAARNIVSALTAAAAIDERRLVERSANRVDAGRLAAALDHLAEDAERKLEQVLSAMSSDLDLRLRKAQDAFVSRGTTALVRHLETFGHEIEWTYDPTGLRLLLKSGYIVFCARLHKAAEAIYRDSALQIQALFEEAFGLSHTGFALEAPPVPAAPTPVILGRTIALDIKGSWWSRWWRRRRDYTTYAEEFRSLIEAEISPMITALADDHALPHAETLLVELKAFIGEQRSVVLGLAEQPLCDLDHLRAEQAKTAAIRSDSLKAAYGLLVDLGTSQTDARRA